MSPALSFTNLQHSYGTVTAVKDVSLTVSAGEVVCLLGPSGCGKTTALRLAAGLEQPSSGEVHIGGHLVADKDRSLPPEDRNVGLVFQDYALFPHLTIEKNVTFGISNLSKGTQEQRVNETLSQVGMEKYRDSYPHMLSGGQQQRVALARAMARNPELILLDEPFSGLDARLRDQVRDRTLHVLKNIGAASLMVTHDAEEAMYMADRIAVMQNGKIVQMGTPSELYNNPVNAFVAEFFGDVNRLSGQIVNGMVKTDLGNFAAPDMEDGFAEVIVRPEAVHLEPVPEIDNDTGYARVLASRLLGRASLVHLCACNLEGDLCHLHARVSGQYLPEEGSYQQMHVNESQVFVFPVVS